MRKTLLHALLVLGLFVGVAGCRHDLSLVTTTTVGPMCGGAGQPCCATGAQCSGAGLSCNAGTCQSMTACGADYETCCTTGTACSGIGSTCSAGTCLPGNPDPQYGVCGMSFNACLCACGAGDSACSNACLSSSSMDCRTCIGNAQAACCPSEDAALVQCYNDATMGSDPCTTQACVDMRCAAQVTAYNTCLSSSGTRCDAYYPPCYGDGQCM